MVALGLLRGGQLDNIKRPLTCGSTAGRFLAVSWVTDLGCHRVKKGSADVATGTAWPLGRRSPVWAEQQLHRDLGRASYALRDVGQGGRQGHPDGRLRAHQAGEEATKGTVQVPDLGPGKGTYQRSVVPMPVMVPAMPSPVCP